MSRHREESASPAPAGGGKWRVTWPGRPAVVVEADSAEAALEAAMKESGVIGPSETPPEVIKVEVQT